VIRISEGTTERTKEASQGGDSEPQTEQLSLRRDFLWRCLHTVAGGTAAFAALKVTAGYKEAERLREICKQYGTLEAPNYSVHADLPMAPLRSFDELCRDLQVDISPAEQAYFASRLAKISEMLSSLQLAYVQTGEHLDLRDAAQFDLVSSSRFGDLSALIAAELEQVERELLKTRGKIGQRLKLLEQDAELRNRSIRKAASESFKEEVARFGAPYSFADSLVSALTGKNMPVGVTFEVGTPKTPGAVGEASSETQHIIVKDQAYTVLVLTTVHEMGHLIGQQDEYRISSGKPEGVSEFLEEAIAYGFELLAASWLIANSPEQADAAKMHAETILFGHLQNFYSGRAGSDEHPWGMAYLDAAWMVLGSLQAAVNYLLCHDDLTPEMERVVAYKSATCRLPESQIVYQKTYQQFIDLCTLWQNLARQAELPTTI
jgi:hypothetical protein